MRATVAGENPKISPSIFEKFFDFRLHFADDRRLSSIFAGSSPSFRLNFRRRFAFENRRRNEGDFKTFFFRSAGDPPATIEQFFDCRRRNEGEMKAKIEKFFENRRRNEGEMKAKIEQLFDRRRRIAFVSPTTRAQNVKNFRTIRFTIILPSNMPGTGIRTIYLGITPSPNLT